MAAAPPRHDGDIQRHKKRLPQALHARAVPGLLLWAAVFDRDIRKVANQHAEQALEFAGQTQLGQESVDFVGRFAHVINEQNRVLSVDLPRGTQGGADHGQVAPHQAALGAAAAQALQRELRWLGQPSARTLATLQLVKQGLLGRRLAIAQQVRCQHGAVKADKASFARYRQVQRGDVA